MPVKKRKINQTQADNPEAQVDSAEDDIVVFPPQSDTYNYQPGSPDQIVDKEYPQVPDQSYNQQAQNSEVCLPATQLDISIQENARSSSFQEGGLLSRKKIQNFIVQTQAAQQSTLDTLDKFYTCWVDQRAAENTFDQQTLDKQKIEQDKQKIEQDKQFNLVSNTILEHDKKMYRQEKKQDGQGYFQLICIVIFTVVFCVATLFYFLYFDNDQQFNFCQRNTFVVDQPYQDT